MALHHQTDGAPRRRVLIMGAAGRDFHNFLCRYRDDPQTEVVAFTAAQIPSIAARRFPASLAGPSYPDGIPIYPESDLEDVVATCMLTRWSLPIVMWRTRRSCSWHKWCLQ